jgi:glycosyltransferase involved in cell wall biosynthesis
VCLHILLATLKNRPIFKSFVPSKIFDYMACERPVVLNVPCEAAEIVNASGCGVCIPPGDREAMVQALCELAGSVKTRFEMGQNGRKFVTEHFDSEVDIMPLIGSPENSWMES